MSTRQWNWQRLLGMSFGLLLCLCGLSYQTGCSLFWKDFELTFYTLANKEDARPRILKSSDFRKLVVTRYDWNGEKYVSKNDESLDMVQGERAAINCANTEAIDALEIQKAHGSILRFTAETIDKQELSGAVSVHTACVAREAVVFLAPSDQVVPWSPLYEGEEPNRNLFGSKNKTNYKRIGHQVTVLSDGRLLISGGSSLFRLGWQFTLFGISSNRSASNFLFFHPVTGSVVESRTSTQRVFHTATRAGDNLLVVGGFSFLEKGGASRCENANGEYCGLSEFAIDGNDVTWLSEDKEDPRLTPLRKNDAFFQRGFHKLVPILKNANGQSQSDFARGLLPIGGFCGVGGGCGTPLIFHQANTPLDGSPYVLFGGGLLRPRLRIFQASPFVWGFPVGGPFDISKEDAERLTMTVPRAGHTMTPVEGGFLVYGGFETFAATDERGGDRFLRIRRSFASAEFLAWKNGKWENGKKGKALNITYAKTPEGKVYVPEKRVFHTATRLDDGRILIAGGIRADVGSTSDRFYAKYALLLRKNGKDGWCALPIPQRPRFMHTATRLPSGQVLLFGGSDFVREEGKNLLRLDATDKASLFTASETPRECK